MKISICAFLGNYGKEYTGNRHNVAWQFLESSTYFSKLAWKNGFNGHWSKLTIADRDVLFIVPETYMNLSGKSVSALAKFYKIETQEILVVHDELELPFGFFGFKQGGGLGGHNGLRSINQCMGNADFMRLRFGIGRPSHTDIAGYVLTDFLSAEKEALACSVFPRADKAMQLCLEHGFDLALSSYTKHNALA